MPRHDDEPVLITEAKQSFDDEFKARKKRYSIIMACRIPCLVLAGVFGIAFNLPLVAVAFIVLSVPLPWVAVLIANDRLPKKAEKVNRYRRPARGLEPVGDRQIIQAAETLEARDRAEGADRGDRGPRTDGPRQEGQDEPEHRPPRTGTDPGPGR